MAINPVVFVYGSLKMGFHNHRVLRHGHAVTLGAATTAAPYLMKSGVAYPFLFHPANVEYHDYGGWIGKVRGEAYVVTPGTMAALDHLEGHPDYYVREEADIVLASAETIGAWIYFLPEDPCNVRGSIIMPDEAGIVEWTQVRVGATEEEEDE